MKKNGGRARRWKEYVFLFVGAIVGALFGGVHDLVTSRISWEFFCYFKGLAESFNQIPPGGRELAWQAWWLGMKASWSIGLIAAVAVLIANNPGKTKSLGYKKLYRMFIIPIAIAAVGSMLLGTLGYFGLLDWIAPDGLTEITGIRPANTKCVWTCNLGAYLGGLIGIVIVVLKIIKSRRIAAAQLS